MIQRIQTIYLFLAAAALGGTFFAPFATASGDSAALASTGDNFFADGVYWVKEFPGGISLLFAAACTVYAIFLYKNRRRQMNLAGGMVILTVMLCALFGALGYFNATHLPDGAQAHLALGSAFPAVSILLLGLAYRAIQKDEALVRSSDRLR